MKKNTLVKLTHYGETKKRAHGSQIVKAKENLKYHYKRAIIGLPAKRHLTLTFKWRFAGVPMMVQH